VSGYFARSRQSQRDEKSDISEEKRKRGREGERKREKENSWEKG